MTNDERDDQRAQAEEQIERELRQGRKFTAQEAMARLAGPGAMKGASPISPVQQAETEIGTWLMTGLPDAGGALRVVLHRNLRGSRLLLDRLDRPLEALAEYCRLVLAADSRLRELVREADVEWGRAMDELPLFEREGAPPNPGDPYTVESVRAALDDIVRKLPEENI